MNLSSIAYASRSTKLQAKSSMLPRSTIWGKQIGNHNNEHDLKKFKTLISNSFRALNILDHRSKQHVTLDSSP